MLASITVCDMSITFELIKTLDHTKPAPVHRELLPSTDSPDLVLVPASSHEYFQTALLNSEEWSGPLNLEQYLQREVVLQEVDLTKNGKITGWILTSTALPNNADGTRPILASCESIAISAFVVRGGELRRVQAHGIASVFTRSEHRGKGYAGKMMSTLGKRLESWQQVDGLSNPFSVLFSDIGKNFYARLGWKMFESNHIHLDPLDQEKYAAARASLPSVEYLGASDLSSLPTVRYMEVQLERLSKSEPSKTFLGIAPDPAHFEWHHAREELQAKLLGKNHPDIKGAIHPESGLAIIWCRSYASQPKDRHLKILHTVIPPDQTPSSEEVQQVFAALLLRAQFEASNQDMVAGVEVWDPSELVINSARKLSSHEQGKVEIITRDQESLCSLRWAASTEDDPVWITKQKYAWC